MTNENINNLKKAYTTNLHHLWDYEGDKRRQSVAFLATIIDYLRGDIEGLPSPLSDLTRNPKSSPPPPPADNGDPNPIATETLKRLGSLGLQSLADLKGYKTDENNHLLLYIKGRFADSGWLADYAHLEALKDIMETYGLQLPLLAN